MQRVSRGLFAFLGYAALMTVLWLIGDAVSNAQTIPAPPGAIQHVTPTPGFKAVLNVYWVDTKSLDIVAESSYWFADLGACSAAMPKGFAIAQEAANDGEEAILECKSVHRQGETVVPDGAKGPMGQKHIAPGTVDL